MGRPKKEAVAEAAAPAPEPKKYDLKACPNCGTASTGPYKDKHGNFRCHCGHPKCGFWDSMVYNKAKDAADGWNAAGGKDKIE